MSIVTSSPLLWLIHFTAIVTPGFQRSLLSIRSWPRASSDRRSESLLNQIRRRQRTSKFPWLARQASDFLYCFNVHNSARFDLSKYSSLFQIWLLRTGIVRQNPSRMRALQMSVQVQVRILQEDHQDHRRKGTESGLLPGENRWTKRTGKPRSRFVTRVAPQPEA